MPHIPRDIATRLGHGAVAILKTGHYLSPSEARVEIGAQVEKALGQTVAYPPDREVRCELDLGLSPRISVENQTVLEVGRRLAQDGPVVALNFANGEYPGGGFLNGARAQEALGLSALFCGGRRVRPFCSVQPEVDFILEQRDIWEGAVCAFLPFFD